MNSTVADRLNPAAGCRIMPCPRPRAVGLTMSQVKASRTPMKDHLGNYVGVLKVHMVGGTQGIGMISTARSARSLSQPMNPRMSDFWLKGVRPANMRPAGKRRSPKKGPRNHCFIGKIPTGFVYAEREFHGKLSQLTDMYKAIARERAGTSLEDQYENLREEVIGHYGRRGFAEIDRMERTIRQNTGR